MNEWIKGRRPLKSGKTRKIILKCTKSYKRLKNINSTKQVGDKMIRRQRREMVEAKKFAYPCTLNKSIWDSQEKNI